ncbi:MAG: hypothetical protein SXA11_03550 [Cyanobacteriota bacterium]|nr:hypothetical protein [Cyanobacteriota bacterium]
MPVLREIGLCRTRLSTRAKLIRHLEQARRLFYGEIKNNFM